jgi:hypothetical protein
MAIARGAGTEIIRSHHFEDVDDTERALIFGVQHHIYTVLSVVIFANAVNAAGNFCQLYLLGYDTTAGTSAQNIFLMRNDFSAQQTFIWNDKFSFNGHEPTDFSATLDSIAKQDAIADQGSSVPQKLYVLGEHASDSFEGTVTFIDQNNA